MRGLGFWTMRYSTSSSDGSLIKACDKSTVNGRNKTAPGNTVENEMMGGETERFGLMVTCVAPTLMVLIAASTIKPHAAMEAVRTGRLGKMFAMKFMRGDYGDVSSVGGGGTGTGSGTG